MMSMETHYGGGIGFNSGLVGVVPGKHRVAWLGAVTGVLIPASSAHLPVGTTLYLVNEKGSTLGVTNGTDIWNITTDYVGMLVLTVPATNTWIFRQWPFNSAGRTHGHTTRPATLSATITANTRATIAAPDCDVWVLTDCEEEEELIYSRQEGWADYEGQAVNLSFEDSTIFRLVTRATTITKPVDTRNLLALIASSNPNGCPFPAFFMTGYGVAGVSNPPPGGGARGVIAITAAQVRDDAWELELNASTHPYDFAASKYGAGNSVVLNAAGTTVFSVGSTVNDSTGLSQPFAGAWNTATKARRWQLVGGDDAALQSGRFNVPGITSTGIFLVNYGCGNASKNLCRYVNQTSGTTAWTVNDTRSIAFVADAAGPTVDTNWVAGTGRYCELNGHLYMIYSYVPTSGSYGDGFETALLKLSEATGAEVDSYVWPAGVDSATGVSVDYASMLYCDVANNLIICPGIRDAEGGIVAIDPSMTMQWDYFANKPTSGDVLLAAITGDQNGHAYALYVMGTTTYIDKIDVTDGSTVERVDETDYPEIANLDTIYFEPSRNELWGTTLDVPAAFIRLNTSLELLQVIDTSDLVKDADDPIGTTLTFRGFNPCAFSNGSV